MSSFPSTQSSYVQPLQINPFDRGLIPRAWVRDAFFTIASFAFRVPHATNSSANIMRTSRRYESLRIVAKPSILCTVAFSNRVLIGFVLDLSQSNCISYMFDAVGHFQTWILPVRHPLRIKPPYRDRSLIKYTYIFNIKLLTVLIWSYKCNQNGFSHRRSKQSAFAWFAPLIFSQNSFVLWKNL